jgi:phenylalanyl-tRNA synthetase beta chain
VPSLLGARQINESLANSVIELFEIAHVYLPRDGQLPREEPILAITSGGGYLAAKGAIESLIGALNPAAVLEARSTRQELLEPARSAELWVRVGRSPGELLGFLGDVGRRGLERFELRAAATVAELKLEALLKIANLVPQSAEIPTFPPVARDLNLVVDEPVRWADVEQTVWQAAAPYAESVALAAEPYRDAERLGAGKKSFLLTLTLRSREGTLTNEQADAVREKVVAACGKAHGAQLRA